MTGERVIYKWGELAPDTEFPLVPVGTTREVRIELKKEYAVRYVPKWSCDSGNNTSTWDSAPALGQLSFTVRSVSVGIKKYYCHLIDKQGGSELADFTITVYSGMHIPIRKIYLHRNLIEVAVGRRRKFEANVEPSWSASQIKWSIDDQTIASNDGDGWVTAHKIGDAHVTVSSLDGSVTARGTLRVQPDPTNVKIEFIDNDGHSAGYRWKRAFLGYGETLNVVATITPTYDYKGVVWTSSDSSIATVTGGGIWGASPGYECSWLGKIKAGNVSGTAYIRATSVSNPSSYNDFTVIVKPKVKHVKEIHVVPQSLTITKGQKSKLKVNIYPSDADNQTIFWTVPIGAKTTVDQEGNIKGVSLGSSRVIAIAEDGLTEDYSTVTVVKEQVKTVTVTSVSLSNSSIVVAKGSTKQITATVNASGGTDTAGITCISDNSSVADKHGVVSGSSGKNVVTIKGNSVGSTKIKISSVADATKYATLNVNVVKAESDVYVPVNKIVVSPVSIRVSTGSTFVITGQSVLESSSSVEYSGDVEFYSNDSDVASIVSVDNSSSSVAKATILAGSYSGSAAITVASKKDKSKSTRCLVSVYESSKDEDGTIINPVESVIISLTPIR